MRPVWKGSISFGLVTIPIAVYTAAKRESLKFHLLRKQDLSPVNYKRVAEADGKEVPWEDIVKGYEYEKGKYVVLRDDDFQRIDIEATQTIEIRDFVNEKEVNPMYFERSYYLEPQKGGIKAYALLRHTLEHKELMGIAKVVIKKRQYLAGVRPFGKLLVMELMYFADELVEPEVVHAPHNADPTPKEIAMANQLVETMVDTWDHKKYTDDYREAVLQIIEEKLEKGGADVSKTASMKKGRRPAAPDIRDLTRALEESLEARRRAAEPKRTKRAMAHGKQRLDRNSKAVGAKGRAEHHP